jgi:fimbrial chaperone protein
MARIRLIGIVAPVLALSALSPVRASSLSVVPISIDIVQPAATGTMTLRNREARPLNAQVRVFRWTQVDGQDLLEPTQDVIPSPPIVTINPGADYVVRLQRTAAAEIAGEEAYRVVVDELPNPNRQRNGTIALVLRYLVPVFFLSPDATQPKLVWSLTRRNGRTMLSAANNGDKRIQIVDLGLGTVAGRTAAIAKGLAGYVLGHSTRVWVVPGKGSPLDTAIVFAATDHGPVHAPISH